MYCRSQSSYWPNAGQLTPLNTIDVSNNDFAFGIA